jgi:hypothetical protein
MPSWVRTHRDIFMSAGTIGVTTGRAVAAGGKLTERV